MWSPLGWALWELNLCSALPLGALIPINPSLPFQLYPTCKDLLKFSFSVCIWMACSTLNLLFFQCDVQSCFVGGIFHIFTNFGRSLCGGKAWGWGHYQKQVHAWLLSRAVPSFWQCPGPRVLPLHINYGAAGWSYTLCTKFCKHNETYMEHCRANSIVSFYHGGNRRS